MPRKVPARRDQSAVEFRAQAVSSLEARIGVYALCDLDGVPIYVGQSVDGIRARVRRHLTSARSDIIANRQIDVWEIAYVLAWPVAEAAAIGGLEATLFHRFNARSTLMNGTVPLRPDPLGVAPEPSQRVQVMSDAEVARRREPAVRLPRQIEHYGRLVDHYLNVKSSAELRVSMEAHFARLSDYHRRFLEQHGPAPTGSDDGGAA